MVGREVLSLKDDPVDNRRNQDEDLCVDGGTSCACAIILSLLSATDVKFGRDSNFRSAFGSRLFPGVPFWADCVPSFRLRIPPLEGNVGDKTSREGVEFAPTNGEENDLKVSPAFLFCEAGR